MHGEFLSLHKTDEPGATTHAAATKPGAITKDVRPGVLSHRTDRARRKLLQMAGQKRSCTVSPTRKRGRTLSLACASGSLNPDKLADGCICREGMLFAPLMVSSRFRLTLHLVAIKEMLR